VSTVLGPTLETVLALLIAVAAALLGGYLLVWGLNGVRRAIGVWSSDPLPVEEAFLTDGGTEVEGVADSLSEALRSPYDDARCLAYSYSKERKERTRNEEGEYETTWRTVESGSESVPFLVADDTGSIPVVPDAATLESVTAYSSHTGDIRRTERRIDPGDAVHVIGRKRVAAEADADLGDASAYIGDGGETTTFRITVGDELETVTRMFGRSLGAVALGVILVGVFAYLVLTLLPGLAVEIGVSGI